MSNSINISATAATTDPTYNGSPQSAADAAAAQAAASDSTANAGPNPSDLRLVIEDDQAAGSYVYKTIDRRTGEVVQQYPREQILRLREATDYTAGAVIKAKV